VSDDYTSTTTSFELVIIFLRHFSQLFALLFHFFLLINDVRMTIFTHQLLSRKTSTPEVLQCECEYSSCIARGLCRSHFHSTRRKVRHHV